jgi:hypothetical protein
VPKTKDDRQNVPGNIVSMLGGNAAIDPITGKTEQPQVPSPVEEFRDYMSKTPEQRMQENWLRAHGITPEEFAAMSPEEQLKLMDQMRAEIENKLKERAMMGGARRTDILV